jgi:DnaJ-class molecular chaperone
VSERWTECPDCEGRGEIEIDKPVRDFVNGGYLVIDYEECERCYGTGNIEAEDGDDD